jgi:UDP-N-acetylmuramate--alanine ligase
MHVFFSGIGGTGIGPLAIIASQAGYRVSGSDKQMSEYISYLKSKGIDNISIGQATDDIAEIHSASPIDWLVYSSAVEKENPDHPELVFARENNIKLSKRDELLNEIIQASSQKLVAVAGTHGKTTTTAMVVWLFKELGIPVSYSVGAKISFGEMGQFDPKAEYFVYECDEYDRNFLAFHPFLSIITGIAYDHHDVFPTEDDYKQAFDDFLSQSQHKIVFNENERPPRPIGLAGLVNRQDAWLAVQAVAQLTNQPAEKMVEIINKFPGVSRRFEKIVNNLYTDYAHTPEKIAGCLQLAHEISNNVVVVYEPLTNKRQHEIKDQYKNMFQSVKKLYWVPSYLTREDPNQPVLSPVELIENMDNKEIAEPADLNNELKSKISQHVSAGDLVVCLSGGGGGSLDEWLRNELA